MEDNRIGLTIIITFSDNLNLQLCYSVYCMSRNSY